VALFTLAVFGMVTVALGLAPGAQTGAARLDEALKRSGARSIGSRRGSRVRDALVVAEISVSLVMLVGAGLMIRSLRHLASMNPGYDTGHVVSFRVSLPRLQAAGPPGAAEETDRKVAVAAEDLLRRVEGLPSVQAASMATDGPLSGSNAVFYTAEGQPPMNAQSMPRAYFHRVSREFFRTLRTRFVAGRGFSEEEVRRNADVAIVTENLAARFWPGRDAIGKRIKVGQVDSPRPWLTIVGVVEELKYRGLPRNPTADPDLFQVFNVRSRDFAVLVRTALEPGGQVGAMRAFLKQVEPSIVVYNASTLEELAGRETALPRFVGWLMTVFSGLALLLATIGVYGVIAYSVSRQTREIGLRVALGAGRRDVVRMVVTHGMTRVACGVALGIAAALALTRALGGLIYEVTATDPLTFTGAAALLTGAAMAACLLPAARASGIDPAAALRD